MADFDLLADLNQQATQALVLARLDSALTAIAAHGTEATQLGVLARLIDIFGAVDGLEARADVMQSTRASEVTLQGVLARLIDIFGAVDGLEARADVATSTRASETTLQSVLTRLQQTLGVADDYALDRTTVDQAGTGAMLSFDLGGPASLVAVDVDNSAPADAETYICRVRLDGIDPTASRGWRCRSGQTTYLPVPCPGGIVKVFAPIGVTVSVQAGAR